MGRIMRFFMSEFFFFLPLSLSVPLSLDALLDRPICLLAVQWGFLRKNVNFLTGLLPHAVDTIMAAMTIERTLMVRCGEEGAEKA